MIGLFLLRHSVLSRQPNMAKPLTAIQLFNRMHMLLSEQRASAIVEAVLNILAVVAGMSAAQAELKQTLIAGLKKILAKLET